jgi:hypothetical protein
MKDLEKVFEIALVLIGLLAAAELQYVTAIPTSVSNLQGIQQLSQFTFRITTVPFVVLIIAWIVKEIFIKIKGYRKLEIGITLFCWYFLSFLLYTFLLLLFVFSSSFSAGKAAGLWETIGYLVVAFAISSPFILLTKWAYGKIYSNQDGTLFNKTGWYSQLAYYIVLPSVVLYGFLAVWALQAFG